MAATRDVALASRKDAFMRLMRLGPLPQRSRLFEAYERDGWPGVHDEIVRKLVKMLRAAERERHALEEEADQLEADQLALALGDVFRYQNKGYGLGRCGYVPADLPQGAKSDEIEEYQRRGFFPSREATVLDSRTARYFSHYFLSASARPLPKWCPDHSLAARQRTHRQKKSRRTRSGKYIF